MDGERPGGGARRGILGDAAPGANMRVFQRAVSRREAVDACVEVERAVAKSGRKPATSSAEPSAT